MKFVTLQELIELGKANPNYTFSYAPDMEDKDYAYFKTGYDIGGDLIHFCGGEIEECLMCYINFFNSNEEYLETYCIKPTETELIELYADCEGWHFVNIL